MALKFLGYVSETNTEITTHSTLYKRVPFENPAPIRLNPPNTEIHASHQDLVSPIEILTIDPTFLNQVALNVQDQNVFSAAALIVVILSMTLIAIIALTALYRVCLLKPSCSSRHL